MDGGVGVEACLDIQSPGLSIVLPGSWTFVGGPTMDADGGVPLCCYDTVPTVIGGKPMLVNGVPRTARLMRDAAWLPSV